MKILGLDPNHRAGCQPVELECHFHHVQNALSNSFVGLD
jgi:hypothetical protein